MFYFLVGQIIGQWSFIVKKVYTRGLYFFKFLVLSVKRALLLYNPTDFMLYCFWLFSKLGWRRGVPNSYRYYQSSSSFLKRTLFLSLITVLMYLKVESYGGLEKLLLTYSEWSFNLFSNPILTEKGYLPYAILVSCSLVWLFMCLVFFYFKSIRAIVQPYFKKIILLNLVIFILLMSLFAKVGRAKFGIRVWYPSGQIYGERVGFEFWD